MEIRESSADHGPLGLMNTVKNKTETLLQTVASESQHVRLFSDLMVRGCPHSHAHGEGRTLLTSVCPSDQSSSQTLTGCTLP